MEFCPQCRNMLDIGSYNDVNYTSIDSITEILKLKDVSIGDFSRLTTNIPREELIKNNKFLKLTEEERNNILNIYKDTNLNIVFICDNCKYTKLINSTVLIYRKTLDVVNIEVSSIEENRYISQDPLLPHTKDYVCPNTNCKTHKDITLKDAVSYKKHDFIRHYICRQCFHSFTLE